MGELEAARRHFDRAVELTREQDDVLMANLGHAWYVYHPFSIDLLEPEAALRHAQRALEYAEQSGSSAAFLMAHWALGVAHELNGRPDEGIREIEHALALIHGRGWAWCGTPFTFCDLAQAYLAAGDARARNAMEEAARHRGPGREGAKIDLTIARVLRRTEGVAARSEIEGALEHGFALVEQTGTVALEPELRAERAELARLLGDRSTSERELREAHRLLVKMGALRRAAQLAQELD